MYVLSDIIVVRIPGGRKINLFVFDAFHRRGRVGDSR